MSEANTNIEQSNPSEVTPPMRPRNGHSKVELSDKAETLFREMWASVFFSGKLSKRAVLVTGPAPHEGATTVACGLGVSGAGPAAGAHVALVDFNLRSPTVYEKLGLKRSPGLTEALADGADLASIAQRVNDTLDVFVAGEVGNKSLNVLRSKAVGKFFDILVGAYDYVVIDVAAANHFPDAQVLASVVNEVLLVVNADVTPREAVAQAKKRIESGGGRVIGVVLNQRTYPIPNFLYRRV